MRKSLNSPFRVPVKPSLTIYLLVVLPHLSAISIVVFLVVSTSYRLTPLVLISCFATTVFILFSLIYFARLHLLQNLKKSVLEIQQDSAQNWTVVTRNQELKQVELLNTSFISTLIVVLNFKGLKREVYTTVFAADSLPDQDFRRLRVSVNVA